MPREETGPPSLRLEAGGNERIRQPVRLSRIAAGRSIARR
jgi:hypothetical protein